MTQLEVETKQNVSANVQLDESSVEKIKNLKGNTSIEYNTVTFKQQRWLDELKSMDKHKM